MSNQIVRAVSVLLLLITCAFVAGSRANGKTMGDQPTSACGSQNSYWDGSHFHAPYVPGPVAGKPFNRLPQGPNPIDDTMFFVRQHYIDFLKRDPPDTPGWNFWASQITQCGSNASCIDQKRVDVSRAFLYDGNFINLQFPINPDLKSPQGLDPYNRAFIRQGYLTYLRREPEQAGFDFWLGVLNSYGSPTPGQGYDHIIRAFLLSTEYRARFVSPPC